MEKTLTKFVYKTEKEIDIDQLTGLFNSVNWRIARFPQKLFNAIKNSTYVLSAWEDVHLVGILSAISDGSANAFITYLIVEPNYQGMGIGKKLIEDFIAAHKGVVRKLLTTETDLEGYYSKFGFVSGGTAMFNEADWRWGNE